MREPTGYCNAKHAQELLEVSNTMFYEYVSKGWIRTRPRGKKYSVYNLADIEALRGKRTPLHHPHHPPGIFVNAAPEDVDESSQLVYELFGTYPNVSRRTGWVMRNPDVCSLVKAAGKIQGVSFELPLSMEKIETILDSKITPNIYPEEVQVYEPGQHYTMYIMGLGVRPSASRRDRRLWAARLISGIMHKIVDLGKRGVIIDSIWSRSDTREGIRTLKGIGFTEVEPRAGYRVFKIDVPMSGIPIILDYKSALRGWQQEHERNPNE